MQVLRPALPPLHSLDYPEFLALVDKIKLINELQAENNVDNAKKEAEDLQYAHFDEVTFFSAKRNWSSISPSLWTLFWLLDLKDLEVHTPQYQETLRKLDVDIQQTKKDIDHPEISASDKRKAERDLERFNKALGKLKTE